MSRTAKPPIKIPQNKLGKGIRLCRDNSLRLLKAAKTMLEIAIDPRNQYEQVHLTQGARVLQTLGIEEFGKAILLKKYMSKDQHAQTQIVTIKRKKFDNHNTKVSLAMQYLYGTHEIETYSAISIYTNSSTRPTPVNLATNTILFPAGLTGTLTETEQFNNPVNFRFDKLYVDVRNGQWISPNEDLSSDGLRGTTLEMPEGLLEQTNYIIAKINST